MVGGAATTTVLPVVASGDQTTQRCARWLCLQEQIDALQTEWARIEQRLSHQHEGFFKLSNSEQEALPDGGSRMAEIDSHLDQLFKERERLLPSLARLKARTPEAALAKLAVVRELLHPDDFPEGRKMLADSITDLTRILQLGAPV